jgi:glutamate-ammonia-ligase adenylyltransferase
MDFNLDVAATTANPDQAIQTLETVLAQRPTGQPALSQAQVNALLRVVGNSNFLARWSHRFPKKAAEITLGNLNKAWDEPLFKKELGYEANKFRTYNENELSSALLDFKYRHYFRITLRDLGLGKPFAETAGEISALASTLLQVSLEWFQSRLNEELGKPVGSKKTVIPFTILGLGKLGGGELNYSSDVDLIYFYKTDHGKVVRNNKTTATNPHEYFTKLSQKLTQFLNQKTAEGFLYRVDLELRPEGKSGTLANSIDAMEDYYESFGADWEKQAMIKASLAAGSRELFDDFIARIHPFVYPKFTDFSFLPRLKEMKAQLLAAAQKSSAQGYHVKLGKGGIREIEFFVQSFQLILGGKHFELQTPNTLNAIHCLRSMKFLNETEADGLSRAYIYLRTMEHRLQQVDEQQTHRLPEEETSLKQLARMMGYHQNNESDALEKMLEDLEDHRRFVERLFDSLLSRKFSR